MSIQSIPIIQSAEQLTVILQKNQHQNQNQHQPRTILWFSAKWCGPCQRMDKPTLKSEADSLGFPLYYVDIETVPQLAEQFEIKSLPTFVLTNSQGQVDARRMNADTTKICQWMRQLAKQYP